MTQSEWEFQLMNADFIYRINQCLALAVTKSLIHPSHPIDLNDVSGEDLAKIALVKNLIDLWSKGKLDKLPESGWVVVDYMCPYSNWTRPMPPDDTTPCHRSPP